MQATAKVAEQTVGCSLYFSIVTGYFVNKTVNIEKSTYPIPFNGLR